VFSGLILSGIALFAVGAIQRKRVERWLEAEVDSAAVVPPDDVRLTAR
jgi:hypothetical protein